MKKILMIIPLVILLCFTFGCQQYYEEVKPTVDIEADIAAIESLTNQVMNAWNEGDLDAFMATVAEDAVYMPPGEPVLIGKEAIRNWYDFGKETYDVTISSDEIEICGDWAIQRETWKGSWIQKDSGETTQFESKDINIYRRQPDGSWKKSHSIWNFTSRETSEK